MRIYIVYRGLWVRWFTSATYQADMTFNWSYPLNTNYLDDIRQINELMEIYPTRTDKRGIWLHDPWETFTFAICTIIRAEVRKSVQTAPSLANLRAMAAFDRCGLPRDICGVIRSFACADNDHAMMRQLFDHYVCLEQITGVDIYVCGAALNGPRLSVTSVVKDYDHYEFTAGRDTRTAILQFKYVPSCENDVMPHFCMHVYTLTVRFKTTAEISFVHKALHKRLPCE